MEKIFISYAAEDHIIAHDICRILEAHGAQCWIAPRNIPYGGNYAEAIMNGIESSESFLLLITDNSNSSRHVVQEVERAFNKNKKIIPVFIKPCVLSKSLEYLLSTSQFIKAEGEDLESELIKMIAGCPPTDKAKHDNKVVVDKQFNHLFDSDIYEIREGNKITLIDIQQAVNIDAENYADELRATSETCFKWYRQNPLIYSILVHKPSQEVAGYINAMPIEDEFFSRLEKGDFIDVDIPECAIRSYDFPDFLKMYFCSIAVHPAHQGTMAYKILYDAFMNKLYHLACNDFYVTEIVADAVTDKGKKMAQQFGMQMVHQSSHGSSIFKLTMMPPKFRCVTKDAKRLYELYKQKYNDFRHVFE